MQKINEESNLPISNSSLYEFYNEDNIKYKYKQTNQNSHLNTNLEFIEMDEFNDSENFYSAKSFISAAPESENDQFAKLFPSPRLQTETHLFSPEYEEMKGFIKDNQFHKIRELDAKILNKEIMIRKEENSKRLRAIEEKLKDLDKSDKQGGPRSTMASEKDEFVLANLYKDGGYRIISKKEFDEGHDRIQRIDMEYYKKK
jgi:hypothetical protein